MQRIGWIIAVLIALGWLAYDFPLENAISDDLPKVQTCWRRTADGWENANQWTLFTTTPMTLHPVYFAMMQFTGVSWIGLFCYLVKFDSKQNARQVAADEIDASLLESNTIIV